MQPIIRCDAAIADMFAEQNILAGEGDQQGVLHIMIERVGIGDALQ